MKCVHPSALISFAVVTNHPHISVVMDTKVLPTHLHGFLWAGFSSSVCFQATSLVQIPLLRLRAK